MPATKTFTGYECTYIGEDPTMVRPHPYSEKVEVAKGETVVVEENLAQRLKREYTWDVGDEPQKIVWEAPGSEEQEDPRVTREKEIKAMKKDELDAYIAAHESIPADLKNNDEKKAAIIGFEFDGAYPATTPGSEEEDSPQFTEEEIEGEVAVQRGDEQTSLPQEIVLAERQVQ